MSAQSIHQATINGARHLFPAGLTILQAAKSVGIEIPSLCDDPRLKPCGACRLCLVEVRGQERPAASCHTELGPDMVIETHTPALEAGRRAELGLLASRYPAEAAAASPGLPFHQLLTRYGVAPSGVPESSLRDDSHPYIRVDMSRCIYCYRCVRICEEVQGQFVWKVRNRADAVRIVPDAGQPFGETSCVSCGACVDTCPTGALDDRVESTPNNWTRTTCPYCGVGCEMEAGVADGSLVRVRPVLDAPVNRGHLCVKGRYAFAYVHAPDRVTHPMIRRDGVWTRVGWDEAIRFVADRLSRIISDHGPDAIGVLGSARGTNEENYVAQKFARVVVGTNNVDCCARVCHAPTAAGMAMTLGTGAATNSYDDIEEAAAILVYGANATENHPVVGARIKQAALRGTPLIVVDPRRTELARFASIHLAVRPGTDVALLNAMANAIVEEGLVDEEFVSARVAEWREFREFIRLWTPESVAEQCGLDADKIRRAARLYATSKPAMSIHGLGLTEHVQGTEGVMCLMNLAMLTGNLGKPGAGVNPLRGQNNVQGSAHMGCAPDRLTGYGTLARDRERFELLWGAAIPTAPGKTLLAMMDSAAQGTMSALWTIGYDILPTNAHEPATREALSKLELVIVQDMFLTETAKAFGTVFLPAASSFEKEGTFMNAERRVQRVRKAIEPVGESKADWEIVCAVAREMGHADTFTFADAEQVWNEVRRVWPGGAGMSYRRLDEAGLQWPCPDEGHPGTTILHADSFPIGERAALRRVPWRPAGDQVSNEFPILLTTGRSLFQFNAGTMTMRTPNTFWRPTDLLEISTEDAAAMGFASGDRARVTSRYGHAELPVQVSLGIQPGEAFATFQDPDVHLNEMTSPARDAYTATPAYKVTAVRISPPESSTPRRARTP